MMVGTLNIEVLTRKLFLILKEEYYKLENDFDRTGPEKIDTKTVKMNFSGCDPFPFVWTKFGC